jgi:hypothetical protein
LHCHIRSSSILRAMKFDGERWQLFGPIIEDTSVGG